MKIKKIIIATTALVGLIGCSSNKAPIEAPIEAPIASAPVASAPVQTQTVSNNNASFFEFDKYNIQNDYFHIVSDNANYLASNPQAKAQIQGNTDDIGSVEYNLSLGQKRADAVKKALIADGVSSSQIEATSNGKLKPVMSNDADDGRAFNRRADIYIQGTQPDWYSVNDGLPMQNRAQ